jgi:hypothetical protein
MLRMVPLPRFRGGRISALVLAAHVRPSFANTATLEVRRESRATEKEGVVPAISCPLRPFATPRNKGSGTPTDAVILVPCCWARPRIHRDAHIYRRSTAVLTQGRSPPKGPAPGHASWDVAERRSLDPPSGGRSARRLCGCYPPEPVPVQRAPRAPVGSAGRLMPKAARERFATPPAGTALAPLPRCASGADPLLSEKQSP